MQKIESLIPKPSRQLVSNSETTTSQKAPSLPTIPQHGAPGSKTTLAITEQALGRAMAGREPAETETALLASLTSLLGSEPKPIEKNWVGEWGYESQVTGYEFERTPEALEIMAKCLKPMKPSECLGLLGELKLLTVARPDQGFDMAAQLQLYARKLSAYPADIVRKVLTTQDTISKWWPAWADLQDRLEVYMKERRVLANNGNGASRP